MMRSHDEREREGEGKLENRIFVGGLSRDVKERQLEHTFGRFGKIVECQIMVEKETGRSRGFGFITFSDRRGADDAIKHMHGKEFGERVISVNKAEPKIGGDDLDHSERGAAGYSSRGKVSYRGGGPAIADDECFKCGRPGHWARDCPSIGVSQNGPRDALRSGEFNGNGRRDHFADREHHFWERDRYVDERYGGGGGGGGTYNARDRFERGDRFGRPRDQYEFERYAMPPGDRVEGDRYGGSERYGGRERGYERDSYPRGLPDRYGLARPTPRDEGRGQRPRPGPYNRPSRAFERPSSFERW